MKNPLRLLLSALLVLSAMSCNNVLDKKINKGNPLPDIREIKQKDSAKYSANDIAKLVSDIATGKVAGTNGLDGTYRQALDDIKAAREKARADSIQRAGKFQQEIGVYNRKLNDLSNAISLQVIGKGSQPANGHRGAFIFTYGVSNNESQAITSFAGQIIIMDQYDTPIMPIKINIVHTIGLEKNIQLEEIYDFSSGDTRRAAIMNTSFDNLRFSWQPSQVVFQDGTNITLPTKPEDPFK